MSGPGRQESTAVHRRRFLQAIGSASVATAGCVGLNQLGGVNSRSVTLEYVDVAGSRSAETFQPVMDALNDRHDATIELQFVEIPYENIRRQLLTRVGGGNAPDIAAIDQIWLGEFIDGGVLMEIDDVADDVDFDDYLDAFAGIVRHDGHIYGLPTTTDVRGMYWDKRAFEAVGLDPNHPPTTWSEFFDVATQLHDPPDSYGAAYLVTPGRWTTTLYGAGGRLLDADGTEPRFHESAGVDAADFLDRLYNDPGVSAPDPTNENGAQVSRSFLTGQYAMSVVEGSWLAYFWENVDGEGSMDERFGFAPSPSPDGSLATMSGGHIWAGFRSTDHPDIVRDFLTIAAGREFNRHMAIETGEIPTRRSLLDDAAIWDNILYADTVRDLLEQTRLRPVRNWPVLEEHLADALQRVAHDRADPSSALTTAAEQFRANVG